MTAPTSFAPKTPVSVITFIGTYDQFAGRLTAGIQAWQGRQGCQQSSGGPHGASGKVNRTVATCSDGSEVIVYTITDMGHAWPGGQSGGLSDPTAPVNATDLMWEFFAAPRASGS